MHQSFFRPNDIFNHDAYFLDFRAQKFPLIFFNVNPFRHQQALYFRFKIMNNNIKKAPVKFREDLLCFQHFMLIFCFCPKLVIITTVMLYGLQALELMFIVLKNTIKEPITLVIIT